MDLAVDIPEEFKTIFTGVIISQKHHSEIHREGKGEVSGLNFGKRDETYHIYDKERQLKKVKDIEIGKPLTRIEIRYKGKKKLAQKFRDVSRLITDVTITNGEYDFEYFAKIELRKFKFIERKNCRTNLERERLAEIRVLFNEVGMTIARRALNKHGHFERDYGHLFDYADVNYDLNEMFLKALSSFLELPMPKKGKVRYEF